MKIHGELNNNKNKIEMQTERSNKTTNGGIKWVLAGCVYY